MLSMSQAWPRRTLTPEVLAIEVVQHRFQFLLLVEVRLELALCFGRVTMRPDCQQVVPATLCHVPLNRRLVAVLHVPPKVPL